MGALGVAIGSLLDGRQASRQQTSGSSGRPTVMQVAPVAPEKENKSSEDKSDENSSTSTAASADVDGKGQQSALPANPDDLLKNGWIETTTPEAAAKGKRNFENPQTGEKFRFDKGHPGETGFKGIDHYHKKNPALTGKRDADLDSSGNGVPHGSKKSHIIPGDF